MENDDTSTTEVQTVEETLLTPAPDSETPAPAAVDESTGETAPEGEVASGEGDQVTPDTYADFTMPENVTVDADLLAEAVPLFTELGLSQEQAQKLVDFQAKQVQAGSQAQVDAFDTLMNEWQEQSRNDKEFGGDAFEENVKIAQSAIKAFGTPELKQLLEDHGVGNHPEVIRFMVKVGKLTAEDVPGSTAAPTGAVQDRETQLYPNARRDA